MRMLVITDAKGKVIGGMRVEPLHMDGAPAQVSLVPARGQRVQEVEAPRGLEDLKDPDKLMAELTKLLRRGKTRSK